MSYSSTTARPVRFSDVNTRAAFITKTYMHLLGAIVAFVVLEMIFLNTPAICGPVLSLASESWLVVLGGFMIVSWIANHFASSAKPLPQQYLGLGLYVVAEAVIFIPILWIAEMYCEGGVIESAAVVTLMGFAGLTAIVFITRKDFSFLGSFLKFGFLLAIIAIIASCLFGFVLGTFFSVIMIALAGGAILYDTSNIIEHYPEDQYVSASMQLFASVALLFWYVLRIFMSRD